ncbi:MAG: hypothetical protein WA828_20345 [Coleofasciculaceae cyanobacterium]
MHQLFSGRIFADHYQFYILDSDPDFYDKMPVWNEENSRKGYITNGRTIYVGTRATFHDHWLDLYLSDNTPSFEECERALALNLNIVSGELEITTTTGDSEANISLTKGAYIVYVLAFNLGIDSEDYLSDQELENSTDVERYRIVLVLGHTSTEGVVKGEAYLF